MMSMAVIASCYVGGSVRFAQGHSLAMVGVSVMGQAVFMAAATTLVAGHFEVTISRRLDLVGGMAIGADRTALVPFCEQLAVDALIIDLLDLDVAFAASLGHVGLVDRRIPVHGAFDIVHAVAIIAGRRDDQPHLQ